MMTNRLISTIPVANHLTEAAGGAVEPDIIGGAFIRQSPARAESLFWPTIDIICQNRNWIRPERVRVDSWQRIIAPHNVNAEQLFAIGDKSNTIDRINQRIAKCTYVQNPSQFTQDGTGRSIQRNCRTRDFGDPDFRLQ
jgi:hypothetical protein